MLDLWLVFRSEDGLIESSDDIHWADALPRLLHATAVSFDHTAVLFIGPSGSGKSALALEMMAIGAGLIGDDMIRLSCAADGILVSSPLEKGARFGIEARGLGLLSAKRADPALLGVVVNLEHASQVRLPPPKTVTIDGVRVPFIDKVESPAFPAMLKQYVQQGSMFDER